MADETTEAAGGAAPADEAVTPAQVGADGMGDGEEIAEQAPSGDDESDDESDASTAATVIDLDSALAPAPTEPASAEPPPEAVAAVPEGVAPLPESPEEPVTPAEQGSATGPTAPPDQAATTPDPFVEPEAPAPTDAFDSVVLEFQRLHVKLDELARLSQRQMGHIDQLHAENQQLRAGELRQAMAPLLRGLVRHHDNVAKMEESAEDAEAHALHDVRAGLLSVLSIAGVEAFDVAPNEPFDASRHQGVSRTETDDVTLDGTVARMRRCGFAADDGRIVRAAEVDVYRSR